MININFNGVKMIKKQIKEYSKRLRIDINKSDGFNPGDNVILMTAKEYGNIKTKLYDFNAMDTELQLLKNQEQNLKEVINDVIAPIKEQYDKELYSKDSIIEQKDMEIKQLQLQLDLLKTKTNQYNLDMQGLNIIDMTILRKHKKLIKNFDSEITKIKIDPKIIDADAKAIPGDKDAD